MEKIRDITVTEAFGPFLCVEEGEIPGGGKKIELFGALWGKRPAMGRFDPPMETPAHNLVMRTKYAGPEEPFYVPALCRVVGLMINGEVCAGFPSPAEEELRDVISFDNYLIANREKSFLLSVTGDSMTGAGIMEKDLVIVERGRQPKNGDIILAEVDGNWTMKYFRKKGKMITLEAANPQYPPIVPQTELRIAGVITALVRKYK